MNKRKITKKTRPQRDEIIEIACLTKGKLFSKNVNSSFHDGPISFTKDGVLAAYTRVNYEINKKEKSFVI